MNKEETKRAIEVMQAFVDGKQIESRVKRIGTWGKIGEPVWAWQELEYRIASEPEHIQIIKMIVDPNASTLECVSAAMRYLKREGY